jgi:hypothetical protein
LITIQNLEKKLLTYLNKPNPFIMTTKKMIEAIGVLLISSLLLSSCTTSKKTSVACPEYSKDQIYSYTPNHSKSLVYSKENKRKEIRQLHISNPKNFFSLNLFDKKKSIVKENQLSNFSTLNFTADITPLDSYSHPIPEKITPDVFIENSSTSSTPSRKSTFNSDPALSNSLSKEKLYLIDQENECDLITLLNGEEINAKVIEIGIDIIKYVKCENLEGPVIVVRKSEVLMIKYSNGTKDLITTTSADSKYIEKDAQKNDPLGIIGTVSGIVGLFVAGIILGSVAVVFGFTSLKKIRKQPEKYKGRGFAIASIILGFLAVVGAILVLALAV